MLHFREKKAILNADARHLFTQISKKRSVPQLTTTQIEAILPESDFSLSLVELLLVVCAYKSVALNVRLQNFLASLQKWAC